MNTCLWIGDFSRTYIFETIELHDNLALIEKQISINWVPLLFPVLFRSLIFVNWFNLEGQIINIGINFCQKHILLNCFLNVLENNLKVFIHSFLNEILMDSHVITRLCTGYFSGRKKCCDNCKSRYVLSNGTNFLKKSAWTCHLKFEIWLIKIITNIDYVLFKSNSKFWFF